MQENLSGKNIPFGAYTDLNPTHVLVFPKDIQVKKPSLTPQHIRGIKTNIELFSDSSKRRLLFVARNSGNYIKSQVCLTYHKSMPATGDLVKSQLNNFLTQLRKEYPGIHYLWVLEFQKRGFVHFHVFTSICPSDTSFREWAAVTWNGIVSGGDTHLEFQRHPNNFTPWVMASGKYLTKQYLAKCDQKNVPESYHNVGRFWGNSRNMKPVPVSVFPSLHVDSDVFRMIIRIITKRREKMLRKWINKKYRCFAISYSLPSMSAMFIRLVEYYGGFVECNQNQVLVRRPG